MDNKKISMVDIAKMSNVSIATVSRILNKNGRYSPETEKKVLSIIEKYNYKLNLSAKSLRTNISQSIGILVPDVTNEFFAKIIRSIENYITPYNYSLFVCDSNEDEELENLHVENLIAKNVDGIICISGQLHPRPLEKIYDIPIVYIDRRPKEAKFLVQSDNVEGGFLATEELIRKGCKRIIMLRDKRWLSPIRQRYEGYVKAHEKYNLPVQMDLQVDVTVDYKKAKDKMNTIIAAGTKFDGIFACNDVIALSALHALTENGIQVPQQVKITGFDGITLGEFCNPPITTIIQNTDEIGKQCVSILMKCIHHEDVKSTNEVVPVELSVRGTT
nr:LacI family DNA-binding transcriptional regulator [uncultured Caproiciproducens sp.]